MRIWFNKDNDTVYGEKDFFKDINEFKKEANKFHYTETGFGCILDDVEEGTFILISEKDLDQDKYGSLEESESKIAVKRYYYASYSSIESFLSIDGDYVVLDDGSIYNVEGEELVMCEGCSALVLKDKFAENETLCSNCTIKL